MNIKWKPTMVMLLSLCLLLAPAPFRASANEAPADASGPYGYYPLTDSVQAAAKSVLNEQTPDGSRIIAVVREYNGGTRLTRVPDLEVRARTTEGVEYTLHSSATNPIAIQPKETVELSYMIAVDRADAFSLSDLTWVDVDEYASPKTETTIQSIPVSSLEWKGENAVLSNAAAIKQWGEAFTIPALSDPLEYKPAGLLEQNTENGPTTVLSLIVTNKSEAKKNVPDFHLDGKSDKRVYNGNRLEEGDVTLEPGAQRYIHYAIPAESVNELKSLLISTTESFAVDDKTNIGYSIGQLSIALPEDKSAIRFVEPVLPYEGNQPIQFDPLNQVIQPDVEVSMVDLHMHNSTEGGFNAAVAKFKLLNHSDRPIPVPQFQAQLMSSSGSQYAGTRQKTVVDTLIPNVSYIIYYSFILPGTEGGDGLTMEILDAKSIKSYNLPIAMFSTNITPDAAEVPDAPLAFYPFTVKLNSWKADVYLGSAKDTLYKLKLDLNIELQDEVVVDQSFPKMRVELTDAKGRMIGTKSLSFTGDDRLVSGVQTFDINSALFEFSHVLRIYETVETPFGEAERLIKTLKD